LTSSSRPQHGRGVDSASNRNEYQRYFLGVKGGSCLSPSCADCVEIWESQSLSRPVQGLLYLA